jgi:hypothetical protein
MTAFDAIKALREEISGLMEVQKLVSLRARETERKLAEAETDHNALLKMEGTMSIVLDTMRARLRVLEAEAEAEAARKG